MRTMLINTIQAKTKLNTVDDECTTLCLGHAGNQPIRHINIIPNSFVIDGIFAELRKFCQKKSSNVYTFTRSFLNKLSSESANTAYFCRV